MSRTAGEFNETTLLKQRHRADTMLLDDRIKQQFIPKMNIYNYLRKLQNAQVNAAFNARQGKDTEIEIMWMNACGDFSDDNVSCVIGDNELSTNAQTYTLEKEFAASFSIPDIRFRDNEFDAPEAIAKGMLACDKYIAEEYSKYLVEKLNQFSGENQLEGGKGNVISGQAITEIGASDWTAELMAYFARVIEMNRFNDVHMISGHNLYEQLHIAEAKRVDAIGGGSWILWNEIPMWFDLFNVDTINAATTPTPTATPTGYYDDSGLLTYMVQRGSVAMASKNWNPSYDDNKHDTRWIEPSRFMQGMNYDVYYMVDCIGAEAIDDFRPTPTPSAGISPAYKNTLRHKFKIVLNADIYNNPEGCEEDNTGVLRFKNVAETT